VTVRKSDLESEVETLRSEAEELRESLKAKGEEHSKLMETLSSL
jgi:DNA-binding winged helix-turn-helix (wHTH) protein